ncbi:tripartite motif-containing protein 43-like [Erinaceus europaeus]|uniref:Tripartite motif-containing protein 43-like n=1 Tax=Erinaceus europaeus TaxID=9365 RepID=A0A1S3WLV2_ERIEU|nr:tripartite motif-containing protein 43-like [Erinaceus europaeus]
MPNHQPSVGISRVDRKSLELGECDLFTEPELLTSGFWLIQMLKKDGGFNLISLTTHGPFNMGLIIHQLDIQDQFSQPRAMHLGSHSEYVCSICKKDFLDPVTLPCKHSFCKPCLCFRWESTQATSGCPACGEPCPPKTWKSNLVLNTRSFIARRARSEDVLNFVEPICEKHQKSKSFFCEVVKDQLCVLCCKCEGHEDHQHCSVDWMAERYRQELLSQMTSLWEKTQENQRNIDREARIRQTWESYVDLRKKMIQEEYRNIHNFLYNEEKRYLETIERESNTIYQQLSESEYSKGPAGRVLRGMYGELEKMCRIPDLELIQQFGSLSTRSESVQQLVPQPVDTCLSSCSITGLMNRFSSCHVHSFTFYASLNNYESPLLEELRQLILGSDDPDVNSSTSRKYFLAWDSECFTSGQHCWQMNMGDYSSWAMGFCSNSWTGKNDMKLGSEGIYLLLCVKQGGECRLFTSFPLQPQYVESSLGTVGVFLDCARGSVSFVNMAKSSLICSLLSCTFSTPLRPFICFRTS